MYEREIVKKHQDTASLPSVSFHQHNHHIKTQQEKNCYDSKDCLFHYFIMWWSRSEGHVETKVFVPNFVKLRESFQNARNHKTFSTTASNPKSISSFFYLFEEAKLPEK
jgi:hypothetical protein